MAQASGVEKARFESLDGGGTFTVQFNPKELKLDEKASWKASDEHGEDEPHLTYEKGEPTSLSMELIFDTSDSQENVNTKFIVPLRGFMTAQYEDAEAKDATGGGSNKRPCYAKFIWGNFEFDGVVEKVNSTFLMFSTDGTPIRAKVQVGLKERKRPQHAIAGGGGVTLAAGPIVVGGGVAGLVEGQVKTYEVKEGDTIDKVAAKTGGESRNILKANGADPINLTPGEKLVIPMTDALADVLEARRRNEPKRNYKNNPPRDPFDESRNLIDNDPGPSAIDENAPVALAYDNEVGDFANAYVSFGPEYEGGDIDSEGAIGEYGATGAGDGVGNHATNGANPTGEGMGRGEAMTGDREVGAGAIGEYGATGAGDGVGNHATNGANPTGEGMGRGEAMTGDREVGAGAIGEYGATGAGDGVGNHATNGANPTGEGMGASSPMGGDREAGADAVGQYGADGAGDGTGAHSQGGANPTGEGMGAGPGMSGDRETGADAIRETRGAGAAEGRGDHSQGGANPTREGMGAGRAGMAQRRGEAGGAGGAEAAAGAGEGGRRGGRAAAEATNAGGDGEGGSRGQVGRVDVDTDKMREDNQERDAQGGGPGGRRGQPQADVDRAEGERPNAGGGPGGKKAMAAKIADRAEAQTGERPDTKAEVKRAGKAMGLGEVIREAKQNAKDNPGGE